MSIVHLRRIDPSRNMHRFYRLDVQPDLFGGVLLVKEWGRIGRTGAHSCRALRERSPCRRSFAAAGRTQAAARLHDVVMYQRLSMLKALADDAAKQAESVRQIDVRTVRF